MTNVFSAATPVLGLLAFLFVGFLLLSGGSRSGERLGYWFFALGVAWLIGAGAVFWPDDGHARDPVRSVSHAPAAGAYSGTGHMAYFTYR